MPKRLFALLPLLLFSLSYLYARQKEASIDQLRSTVQRLYTESKMDSLHIVVPQVMKRCQAENRMKEYYDVWEKLTRQYHFTGFSERALTECRKILQQSQAEKDSYGQGIAARCLGVIMAGTGNTSEGKKRMQHAIELFGETPRQSLQIAYTLIDLIDIFNLESDSKQVLKQCDTLSKVIDALPDSTRTQFSQEINTLRGYGTIYRINALCEQNRMQEAEVQLRLMRKQLQTHPNELLRQALYQCMMFYYNQLKNYPLTLQYIDSSLENYRQTGYILGENIMMRNKAEILTEMGNHSAATQVYQEYVVQHDSTTSADMSRQINELNAIYDVNRLTEMAHHQEMKSQKTTLYVSVAISTLLVVIVMLATMAIRHFKRLNRSLSRSEANLRSACERAENSARMRQTFIQNMTHEIRTPLNSIVGFSQVLCTLMEGKPEEAELKEYTGIIDQNNELLLRLVGDVLMLSELDSEDTLFERQETNIRLLFETLIDTFQWKVKPGVILRVEPEKERESSLTLTNEHHLRNLLTNLLNNAVKFTDSGSITLSYEVDKKGQQLLLAVTDTGCGIAAEKQPYVFERFMKGNDYVPGTGLGLPICGAIAMRLGGKISLDGKYREGCRFVVALPLE